MSHQSRKHSITLEASGRGLGSHLHYSSTFKGCEPDGEFSTTCDKCSISHQTPNWWLLTLCEFRQQTWDNWSRQCTKPTNLHKYQELDENPNCKNNQWISAMLMLLRLQVNSSTPTTIQEIRPQQIKNPTDWSSPSLTKPAPSWPCLLKPNANDSPLLVTTTVCARPAAAFTTLYLKKGQSVQSSDYVIARNDNANKAKTPMQ